MSVQICYILLQISLAKTVHCKTAFSSQAFRISESYLEIFPRNGRAFLRAEGRALNLDDRVAAVRLLRQGEATEVKRRDRNLSEEHQYYY